MNKFIEKCLNFIFRYEILILVYSGYLFYSNTDNDLMQDLWAMCLLLVALTLIGVRVVVEETFSNYRKPAEREPHNTERTELEH